MVTLSLGFWNRMARGVLMGWEGRVGQEGLDARRIPGRLQQVPPGGRDAFGGRVERNLPARPEPLRRCVAGDEVEPRQVGDRAAVEGIEVKRLLECLPCTGLGIRNVGQSSAVEESVAQPDTRRRRSPASPGPPSRRRRSGPARASASDTSSQVEGSGRPGPGDSAGRGTARRAAGSGSCCPPQDASPSDSIRAESARANVESSWTARSRSGVDLSKAARR